MLLARVAAALVLLLAVPASAWIADLGTCGAPIALETLPDGDPLVVCNRKASVSVVRLDRCDGAVRWHRRLPGVGTGLVALADGSPVVTALHPPEPSRRYRITAHRLDPTTGRRRWDWRSEPLAALDFGAERRRWRRSAGSFVALPDGDLVLVRSDSTVLRLAGDTAAERWRRRLLELSVPQDVTATTRGDVVVATSGGRHGLVSVKSDGGTIAWTREASDTERVHTVTRAAGGDLYVTGVDRVSGSPAEAFVARIGGDGTERWRLRPFHWFPGFERPLRGVVGPDDSIAVVGNAFSLPGFPGFIDMAMLEPWGSVRWRRLLWFADRTVAETRTVQRTANGDVFLLAWSRLAPTRELRLHLEPTQGWERSRVESRAHPEAATVSRSDGLFLAHRAGRSLLVLGLEPTSPDCR